MKLEVPIIGILRGVSAEEFTPLLQASFSSGLQAVEVTMNTAGAEEIIAENRENVPAGKYLGMGTIRNIIEARKAYAAGAMFFVTPNADPEVIEFGQNKDIPVIAGALTPTEVYMAWKAGAAMVKVFPCRALGGPIYIRELRGPFDHIPLVAVGGVTMENGREHLQAGATALGVGISLFGEQAIKRGDWRGVRDNVEQFIQHCTMI
ncbi:MAG: bifunctional 4-hydroxy-2-oxoglutarate aldolase/2-dehydro-3-deoxy-phosphogluconate aldolase [Deltaproteobacteria bacterium]|nr:MAG: bifunctional 4-hydroxy-2-oxoglutarate aldolase/2-dehydro-3-deoxy-phosphogluconate aldolase [Deltaproteobacteria bacterium]